MAGRHGGLVSGVALLLLSGAVTARAQVTTYAVLPNSTPQHTVTVVDTNARTVVGSPISVALGPYGVAMTPDGRHAFIASGVGNHVTRIDLMTRQVNGGLTLLGPPGDLLGIAVTPDSSHVLATRRLTDRSS